MTTPTNSHKAWTDKGGQVRRINSAQSQVRRGPPRPRIGTVSNAPDLLQLDLQPWEQGAGIEAEGCFDALGLALAGGGPDFNGLLVGDQQPAQLGAIGLVAGHLVAQGGEATGPFIAGAGQLHHQIGAEGRETSALRRREGLPTLQAHQRGIRAQHRAIGQSKTARAIEQLEPKAAGANCEPQESSEGAVAGAGFTASGCHVDQLATGIELQHGVGVGAADSPELLWGELQIAWKAKRAQRVNTRGLGRGWCGKRHDPGATLNSG
jgi:hypothetical protein